MPIPDYQTLMLPLLRLLKDKEEHSLQEAIDALGSEFTLTEAEMKELLPSGQQEVFHNRVGWARTYMKKAGLVDTTRRGHFMISDRGLQVLSMNPKRIDVKFLDQFDEFKQFRALRHTRVAEGEAPVDDGRARWISTFGKCVPLQSASASLGLALSSVFFRANSSNTSLPMTAPPGAPEESERYWPWLKDNSSIQSLCSLSCDSPSTPSNLMNIGSAG